MPYLTVGKENSGEVKIFYEDHGEGPPVVLIHGWPLSGRSWEKQLAPLLAAGYRVIAYDRRGFGDSSKPIFGYDYDSFAVDLDTVMEELDLQHATLVGFSMGGGEVARFIGNYGTKRIAKAVFLGAVPPYLRKAEDNPEGVDPAIFEGIKQAIAADRPGFLAEFLNNFFNFDVFGGTRISEAAVRHCWNIAAAASPIATLECVDTWGTDFRKDFEKIDVPTLIVHGDDDRIVPLEATAKRMHAMLENSRLAVIQGGPHGIIWTHAEEVNRELLDFLAS